MGWELERGAQGTGGVKFGYGAGDWAGAEGKDREVNGCRVGPLEGGGGWRCTWVKPGGGVKGEVLLRWTRG